MQIVRVERVIAADPVSVTLVIVGLSIARLWPGATGVDSVSASAFTLHVDLPGRGALAARGRMTSPMRSATSFLVAFTVETTELPPIAATMRLRYVAAVDSTPGTQAALTFGYDGPAPGGLRTLAEGYLNNVTAAAERRSAQYRCPGSRMAVPHGVPQAPVRPGAQWSTVGSRPVLIPMQL